ncbi:Orange carotenoid protein [Pleurocapsales cyanobacterium LEGE 06147]|nr:Orange carotenoid protein [Pleurocapsales cyanobacterium LEGE 06147]
MTYAASNETRQALDMFQNFDTDTKLALLWYGYLDIKENLTPAPPDSVETVSSALFDKIKELSSEEQLQAQRDTIDGSQSEVGQAYSALDTSGRMNAWLLLARGMENGTIIQVPSDYQLPEETQEFTDAISQLDFEQRINFMRSVVSSR